MYCGVLAGVHGWRTPFLNSKIYAAFLGGVVPAALSGILLSGFSTLPRACRPSLSQKIATDPGLLALLKMFNIAVLRGSASPFAKYEPSLRLFMPLFTLI